MCRHEWKATGLPWIPERKVPFHYSTGSVIVYLIELFIEIMAKTDIQLRCGWVIYANKRIDQREQYDYDERNEEPRTMFRLERGNAHKR
jgi:hypothetical protein